MHLFFHAVGIVAVKKFTGRIIRLPAQDIHFMAPLYEALYDIVDPEIFRPVMLAYDEYLHLFCHTVLLTMSV